MQGSDGKYTIQVGGPAGQKQDKPDFAIRLALAMADANLLTQDTAKAKSLCEIELASWRMALKIAGDAAASNGQG